MMYTADPAIERSNRFKALAGTLLIHGVIFLVFFLIVFHNPEPPLFSDTAGVEVNFGFSEDGMGEVQPEPSASDAAAAKAAMEQQKLQAQLQAEEAKLLTQETEDAPEVAVNEKPKPEKKKEEKTKPVTVVKETVKEKQKEEKKEPAVNPSALYKGKQKSVNEGETGKTGDQGIKEGSLYVKNHGDKSGKGDHGTGDGQYGDGGNGKGISFSLSGRKLFQAPKINDTSQETGKVVVDITVDKYGKVTNANPGARGSTTSSANLYRKAKEAALRARFSPSPEGVEEQRGTITFVFIVQ